MKNKGFSLVELVVAMGIGSVVLLMISIILVRGTNLFRAENNEVNMRNDYQIIRNQLDESIMEAKSLVIEYMEIPGEDEEDIIIYTGAIDTSIRERSFILTRPQTTEKVIYYDASEDSIYIATSFVGLFDSLDSGNLLEGNKICDIVTEFYFDVISDDTTMGVDVDIEGNETYYYLNPIRAEITLGLESKKSEVSSTYTVNIRNKIKELAFYYNYGGGITTILNTQSALKYKVK